MAESSWSSSPVLGLSTRSRCPPSPKPEELNLDELYKHLMEHLKKSRPLSKNDLRLYLKLVEKMDTRQHRLRWLQQKCKGLLKYLLKRPCEFRNSLSKGEITIFERTPVRPNFLMQSHDSTPSQLASSQLTNDNFVSMEVANPYSQDIFADTVDSLRDYSQENYELLKSLTKHENEVFKTPEPVLKAHQEHHSVEQELSSLSQTLNMEVEEGPGTRIDPFVNIRKMSNEEIRKELTEELSKAQDILGEILSKMDELAIKGYTYNTPNVSVITTKEEPNIEFEVQFSKKDMEENLAIARKYSEECIGYLKKKPEVMKEMQSIANLAKIEI